MKAVAFFLAVIFFSSSVKEFPLYQFINSSNCTQEIELSIQNNCHDHSENPDQSCCNDLSCECVCCVHQMISYRLVCLNNITSCFSQNISFELYKYKLEYSNEIFHPPIYI